MSTSSAQHPSSFWRRTVLFCFWVVTLAFALLSPLTSAARSQITRGLRGKTLSLSRRGSGSRLSTRRAAKVVRSSYWHAEGNQIFTDRHVPVRITA